MAPPGSTDRGSLVAAPRDRRSAALEREVAASAGLLHALALPSGCAAGWAHAYDYAFATDGTVDVRADGGWHSVPITARAAVAKLSHVAVPRRQADVFRLVSIVNPLDGPLLPGPIDVYDRGTFLVTTATRFRGPGGSFELGLGVDPTVKLARNTEYREETTGVLRGGLRLHHAIKIDVHNLSDRAIALEVRERVPVTRDGDDEIEVVLGKVEPAWRSWAPPPASPGEPRLRGGYLWQLELPAGGRRTLSASYEVKLAGKHELVGGNRREP